MGKPILISVSPAVLKWARQSAGLSHEAAARLLKLPAHSLTQIEFEGNVPLAVLNRMVTVYRRAPTLFLLPNAPGPLKIPQDFRTVKGEERTLSPQVLFAIREAQELRDEISDLLVDDPEVMSLAETGRVSPDDDPSHRARIERERLGVSHSLQRSWPRKGSFRNWRQRVERLGVLVLLKKMPFQDCRGFSLNGSKPNVIVVNSQDESDEGKSFTLFHEYAHLLLHKDGICNLLPFPKQNIERWCNKFSASLLIPGDLLDDLVGSSRSKGDGNWSFKEVNELARKLRVSTQAIALRLEERGFARRGLYDVITEEIEKLREYEKPKQQKKIKGPPHHIRRLSEIGSKPIEVVLRAVDTGGLDAVEASHILRVKPKWFGSLSKLIRRTG
jgi:Zn-dependent peptidase ImmA (M78 family)